VAKPLTYDDKEEISVVTYVELFLFMGLNVQKAFQASVVALQ
jgi:hypothetical protein